MTVKDTVVVMVEDRWIAVDGETVVFEKVFDLVSGHEKLWALHWKDGKGEYQFDNPPKNFFFSKSQYSKWVEPYVIQWEAEKTRQEAEAEAEWNKPENIEARARVERNRLLDETDYILMPDYPLSDEQKTAWMAYRQALRDLPEQDGWPMNIVWPEKPAV